MWSDFRFAVRMLRKRPGVSVIALLTLALGIGATSAVFSIVNAVLLQPLPYRDSDRLVAIWERGARQRGMEKVFAPWADYDEWSRRAQSFESISAATWAYGPSRILTGRGPAKQLLTIPATSTFFTTLGVQAALGRTFTAADEHNGCAVVLAHSFWTTTLHADPSIVGQSLTLDQHPCTVLGVMPARFKFYPPVTQLWIMMGPDFEPPREKSTIGIFARLKPGVSRDQAEAEITAFHSAAHSADFWRDFVPAVHNLHDEFTWLASRTLRITVIVAFAAVLLVLLIAAMNVANLLLARLAERQREFAVRAALGSGQARLVRQILTESLLLATIGSAAGIALAFGAVRYFLYASPIELTAGADVRINLPVLLFTAAVAILTTVISGLLPALSASRVDLIERLKAAGRGALTGALQRRTAATMIALEMGLSFVLLTGAGLLLRSALRMGSEPLGYDADRVLGTRTALPAQRYADAPARIRFYDALLDRLRALPGVTNVAVATRVPPYAIEGGWEALELPGHPVPTDLAHLNVGTNSVSPEFFDVLHMPVLRGRAFTDADRDGAQPVAILSDKLVQEYFPNTDPLGKQVRLARTSAPMPWMTIVGVVGDMKRSDVMNEMSWVTSPILYRPFAQSAQGRVEIIVRTTPGAPPLEHPIQDQIAALDSQIPIPAVDGLKAAVAKTLAYPRFRAIVLVFFAITALLLSAVGLHGVLSQLVAQRTAEFGLRKAIGARTTDLLWLVARQGGVPVVLGLAAGLASTLLFSRLIRSLLYGIEPADPRVLVAISAFFLTAAAIAIALPARRASLVDPMTALRDE